MDPASMINFSIDSFCKLPSKFINLSYRYTKPDSYALPMPNFYETSRTQRNSSIFATVQNYFHGPKLSDLPLAGGFGKGKKSARYIM